MIRPNNPEIDVEELMSRVRAEAARIRTSGKIEERRGDVGNADEYRFHRELDQHPMVSAQIETAERLNRPRAELPKRLRRLGRIGKLPFQFIMRVFNYLMKPQREVSASQNAALRQMIAIDFQTGQYVGKLAENVRALERYRVRQSVEQRQRLEEMDERLNGLGHAHHVTRQLLEEIRSSLARFDEISARLEHLAIRTEHGHERIDSSERTIGTLVLDWQRRMAENLDRMLRADSLLRGDIADLRGRLGKGSATPASVRDDCSGDADLSPALYAAIEDAFRGNRDTIRARLREHIEAVRDAGTISDSAPLFDIGTGRGDWLAVLRQNGIPARGVDTNSIAVNEARSEELQVEQRDALEALQATAGGSFGAVTAFHVVEHLPIGVLLSLLRASYEALVPGGLLLIETPDPRNITVATWGFRLDPTHRHAIPDPLLAVLVESVGFADVLIQRLHPSDQPVFRGEGELVDELNARFAGPQDYALSARRPR
jgi:2-polyprenyl-3-methyl-5-hydroxy-6-metoxy-1,4-benzoquinol methylase